jgi:hypothetical protein
MWWIAGIGVGGRPKENTVESSITEIFDRHHDCDINSRYRPGGGASALAWHFAATTAGGRLS